MATQPINTLINKRDSFEIVRDKIAQILANESANQMKLAEDQGQDPEQWQLDVFVERFVPWDGLSGGEHTVNVWFDNSTIDTRTSGTVNSQNYTGTFYVDVVAVGINRTTSQGHVPSDLDAVNTGNRIARLCRNILMSPSYAYLDLRANSNPDVSVASRSVQSIRTFQPDSKTSSEAIIGVRLELTATFVEKSPENTITPLNEVGLMVRDDKGRVLAEIDFDFTNTGNQS